MKNEDKNGKVGLMLNNGNRKVNPEERKTLIIIGIVFIIFIIYFVYNLVTGLHHTCKGSLIFFISFILIALIAYWRMGERRKQSIIYLFYIYILFGLCIAASMIDNNCFGG